MVAAANAESVPLPLHSHAPPLFYTPCRSTTSPPCATSLSDHHAPSSSSSATVAPHLHTGVSDAHALTGPARSAADPYLPAPGVPVNNCLTRVMWDSNVSRSGFIGDDHRPNMSRSQSHPNPRLECIGGDHHASSTVCGAQSSTPLSSSSLASNVQQQCGAKELSDEDSEDENYAEKSDAFQRVMYSQSSALPAETPLDKTPKLVASVHGKIIPKYLRALQLKDVRFRPFRASDVEELKMLHQEWFPLTYDDTFYGNSVSGNAKMFTCAACLPGDDTCILGLTTISTHCYHHQADISRVLREECDSSCRSGSRIAYILTLGVIDEFRRRGLAKLLILRAIEMLERDHPQVQALTLHVVTYNKAAISLYRGLGFIEIDQLPDYYDLNGTHYGSYLLAKYLGDGRPPLAYRLRKASEYFIGWGQSHWSAISSWFKAKLRLNDTNYNKDDDEDYAMI